MAFSVRKRIHWGTGLFWLRFLANFCLILNVLWDGYRMRKKYRVQHTIGYKRDEEEAWSRQNASVEKNTVKKHRKILREKTAGLNRRKYTHFWSYPFPSCTMVRVSALNDALNTLTNAERRGKRQALIRPCSKVTVKFLSVMQKHGMFLFCEEESRRGVFDYRE